MNKKAQITLEASLIFAIVTAGLLATKAYLGSAIQGNWKTNTDSFSEGQYRPEEDPILNEIDPNPTEETVSELEFINPRINVREYKNDGFSGSMGELDAAEGNSTGSIDGSEIIGKPESRLATVFKVKEWGTYKK